MNRLVECASPVPSILSPCVRYLRRMCCLCPLHGFTTLWDICVASAALVPSMISPFFGIFAPQVLRLPLLRYQHSVGYLRSLRCPCPFHDTRTVGYMSVCAALSLQWSHYSLGYLRRICRACPFHGFSTLCDICAALALLGITTV